jgi:putative transposase
MVPFDTMPRTARRAPGGLVYHVLNRGNDRKQIFHKHGDARAFLQLLKEAKRRFPGMRVLAFCLMNNHWHPALWPTDDGDLSAFMAWLSNAHVRRYRQHYHTAGDGHLYQGRFKSFPVMDGDAHHLLLMLRYVEGNALRAGLVSRAEDWRWSSLHHWLHGDPLALLDEWPAARPHDWVEIVNEALREAELERVWTSVTRGRPFGPEDWVQRIAGALGLDFTLRQRGRPRKKGDIQNIPQPDQRPGGIADEISADIR